MAHCTAADATDNILASVADERAPSVGRPVAGIFNRWATPFAQTASTCKVQRQDGGQNGIEDMLIWHNQRLPVSPVLPLTAMLFTSPGSRRVAVSVSQVSAAI